MQRWLYAVAALLMGAAAGSRAADNGYVIIRLLVNPNATGANQGGAAQMGNQGMAQIGVPGMAQMGGPGNFMGFNGMGARPGAMGGFNGIPPGGGINGKPGAMGGFNGLPPGGFNGLPPGGFNGQPPGGFNGQPMVGGFNGQPMGPNGQPMGANGQPMGIPATDFSRLQPDDYVTAVVELKGAMKKQPVTNAGSFNFLTHKWGKTAIYEDGNYEFMWQPVFPSYGIYSPLETFNREKKAAMARNNVDDFFGLAEKCLQIGLPDKCMEVLDELPAKIAAAENKKEIKERVTKGLAAYKKIKPIITEAIERQDKAKSWQVRLKTFGGSYKLTANKHYVLLNMSDDKEAVQRRLDALENTFKSFYLVFALKGKALPAPSEKLVAILVDSADNFKKQRTAFNVSELVSDGYYARQENLAIFSPTRVDLASRNFEQMMRDVWRKNGTDLFTGKFPDLGPRKEAREKAIEIARAQSMALVDQALREESEIASATHEGAAQLLAETGVLPRTLNAPQWLRFGLASIFEMPKGPFPTNNVAFYPGAYGANWAWSPYFDRIVSAAAGPPSREFLDTFNDTYFDAAHALAKAVKEAKEAKEANEANEPKGPPKGPPPGPPQPGVPPGPGGFPGPMGANPMKPPHNPDADVREAYARARCLSWALVYYMFSDRFDDFQDFLAELAALPRDAEIDHYAVISALSKSFKDLKFEGLSRARPNPKLEELKFISDNWAKFIRAHPIPGVSKKAPGNPGNVAGPGT